MINSYNSPSTKPIFKGIQIVWYLATILEVLLAFRFILKLTGANPLASFTSFIYTLSRPFAAPFLAVFPRTVVEGSIFEWTTLLAGLVYWIVAVAIIRIFSMSRTTSTSEAAAKMDKGES
mgnify:CR=1 FL=1